MIIPDYLNLIYRQKNFNTCANHPSTGKPPIERFTQGDIERRRSVKVEDRVTYYVMASLSPFKFFRATPKESNGSNHDLIYLKPHTGTIVYYLRSEEKAKDCFRFFRASKYIFDILFNKSKEEANGSQN